jgi:uncharacterized membrane protein
MEMAAHVKSLSMVMQTCPKKSACVHMRISTMTEQNGLVSVVVHVAAGCNGEGDGGYNGGGSGGGGEGATA